MSCLKSQEYTILTEDEAFFQRKVYPNHRFWSPSGKRIHTPYIGRHENVVTYGFIGTDGEQFFRTDTKFNSESFIRQLYGVYRKFGDVGIIMDRAAPHRSKMLKEFAHNNDWLKILYFPRGSPYLNPVEEYWHQTKQDLIISGYHPNIKHKRDTMSDYFGHTGFNLNVLDYINRNLPPLPQNFCA